VNAFDPGMMPGTGLASFDIPKSGNPSGEGRFV
jgi:hypothetical protein